MYLFRKKENTLYDYIPPADFLLSLLWFRFCVLVFDVAEFINCYEKDMIWLLYYKK